MKKRREKPPWIKALVWRGGEWVVLNEKTFPVKKGEYIRIRGKREVCEVEADSKVKRDGSITIHAHTIGELAE